MKIFLLGNTLKSKEQLKSEIRDNSNKIIQFFGVEYAEKIMKLVRDATFVFAKKKSIRYSGRLEKMLMGFEETYCHDFSRFAPEDAYSIVGINGYLEFFNAWEEEDFDILLDDNLYAFVLAYLQDKNEIRLTDDELDEIIHSENFDIMLNELYVKHKGEIQQEIEKIKAIWEKKFAIPHRKLYKKADKIYYARLESLVDYKAAFTQRRLAKYFGEFVNNVDTDIFDCYALAEVFLKFLDNKNEEITPEYREMFENMFNILTQQIRPLNEHLNDKILMRDVHAIEKDIHKHNSKFKAKKRRAGKVNVNDVMEYLLDEDVALYPNIQADMLDYICLRSNNRAYVSTILKKGHAAGLVVLNSHDISQNLMHEMLHLASIRDDGRNSYSGICRMIGVNDYVNINEVLTQYFSELIRDSRFYTMTSNLNSLYNFAMPILKPWFDSNLEFFKKIYIEGDIKAFEERYGAENLKKLDEALDEFFRARLSHRLVTRYVKRKVIKHDIREIDDLRYIIRKLRNLDDHEPVQIKHMNIIKKMIRDKKFERALKSQLPNDLNLD